MQLIWLITLLLPLLFTAPVHSAETSATNTKISKKKEADSEVRWRYEYVDRQHTTKEALGHLGAIYLVTWLAYPLTQPSVVREKGSFKNYGHNFGKIVFDRDTPFWNWLVHPISGGQLYLFYRGNGYSRIDSMGLAFISSTLFEFTVEIYTEPASVQDLYQTPVLGSILGLGIENLSMWLLNTGNPVGTAFGHILNPTTLFDFFEGRARMIPHIDGKGGTGMTFIYDF